MTRRLLALLLLACATPAAAQSAYDYTRVYVSEPLTVTGPGSTTWTVVIPAGGIAGTPYLKHCGFWATHGRPELWDGHPPVFDQDINIYVSNVNYTLEGGTFRVTVGDRRAGRTQSYCPRMPFTYHYEE